METQAVKATRERWERERKQEQQQPEYKRRYFENAILCGNCNGTGLQGHLDYCRACDATGLDTFNEFVSNNKGKDLITLAIVYKQSRNELTKLNYKPF